MCAIPGDVDTECQSKDKTLEEEDIFDDSFRVLHTFTPAAVKTERKPPVSSDGTSSLQTMLLWNSSIRIDRRAEL